MICPPSRIVLLALVLCGFAEQVEAQLARPKPPVRTLPPAAQRPSAPAGQPMRKPNELINRQAPINVNEAVYDSLRADETRIIVSLAKQRAFLLKGDQIAIDTPISSGKRAGMTPSGSFSVLEKDKDHRSTVYGDFVDNAGRVVRSGISVRIDSAPSGTHYVGAAMKWFMRLTGDGVGMHIGILPGYPASHGCVRMPPLGAELFYAKVKVGTPVTITAD